MTRSLKTAGLAFIMIIDFHTHAFPDAIAAKTVSLLAKESHIKPQTDGSETGLSESMKEAGADLSVILPVATKPSQVEKINTLSAVNNSRTSETGLLYLGAMHPMYENWYEELARIADLGLAGIKIHPVYQDADIDSPRFLDILKRCAELGLAVITHAGDDIGFPGVVRCSPVMCAHVIDEIPQLRLVLAHMGGWHQWKEVMEVLADRNVMLDTAFCIHPAERLDDGWWQPGEPWMLSYEELKDMIRRFGSDHVLFGTDCPWASQKEYIRIFRTLGLSFEEQENIFHKNAERLLGL